jgi:hypothetical protein
MSKDVLYRTVAQTDWTIWQNDNGLYQMDQVHLAVLMDIRTELVRLNTLLQCPNFTGIPATLRTIATHTKKKRKRTPTRGTGRGGWT